MVPFTAARRSLVEESLRSLKESSAQYDLNGGGDDGSVPDNIWIVKPAGKSRGRGIKVCSNLF
jgi:hypothetical protein